MNEPADASRKNLKKNSLSSMELTDGVSAEGHRASPKVSVCICTYQRPHLLAMLLDSLAGQSFHDPFEIIVVDNDAASSAAQTVEAAKRHHPTLNIRYAVESQKGISFARNTAASLAAGDFLAWIDDDETAAKDWLISLWMTCATNNMDGVFGPVIPVFAKDSPSWTGRSGMFDRLRHPTGTQIDAREARTGNALVKADWFRATMPFDPKFANTGGEDYDFFSRIRAQGAQFAWCDEAEVFEAVPLERQRLIWILERQLRGSTLYWRMSSKSKAEMIIRAGTGVAACLILGLAGGVVAPFGFHHAVRLWCGAMRGLGRVVAVSGLHWRGY